MTVYIVEDEMHAEQCGKFDTFEDAFLELKKRATIAWDKKPNLCPCTNWKNCGRNYEIVEFDNSISPWKELSRVPVLRISAKGIEWKRTFNN